MLVEGQRRGHLGPGPVLSHVRRALDLGSAFDQPPNRAIDLGSGGGLPGLPLALAWPDTRWLLLEGSATRAGFLDRAIQDLDLTHRVSVVASRAEIAGRGGLRSTMDAVIARSFAAPGPTAECAAPFLVPGGLLVVSEPPGGRPERWDPAGLRSLGMALGPRRSTPTSFQVILQELPCPERFPRRVGIPAKRPLF
ncbi:MAG: RsmG family class I SAM-dependent methyltransferase [Acidimicrobiales bacterium]